MVVGVGLWWPGAGLRGDGGERTLSFCFKDRREKVIAYGPKIWILEILNLIKQESAGHVDNCCLSLWTSLLIAFLVFEREIEE